MKLNILSDLHLNHEGLAHPATGADVVILAGDIARPADAVAWARGFERPVLYVPGNHEFYGGSIAGRLAELERLCAGTNVHLLDCGEIVLGGVRFLGTTLWTDLMLFGLGPERDAAIAVSRRYSRDFNRILADGAQAGYFSPDDMAALFEAHSTWLEARLAIPHAGPTVVVTHHAPSPKSIHPRFEDSPLNLCFVSDIERVLDGRRVALWVHGHTHDSFDYIVNGTRVVCNPRGYAVGGINENALFDPDRTIEIGTAPAPAALALPRSTSMEKEPT